MIRYSHSENKNSTVAVVMIVNFQKTSSPKTKLMLEEEIANAINTVTKKDILGWFRKNKYRI